MTDLFMFLGVALALLLTLVVLIQRRPAAGPVEERLQLPDRALMDRILAEEDAAFVENFNSPTLRRLFVRERRRLALVWLRRLYGAARRLRQKHVESARHSGDARLGAELRLACEFGAFIAAYVAVVAFVVWVGPFRGRRVLGPVDSLVGALDGLGRRIAASVDIPQRGAVAA